MANTAYNKAKQLLSSADLDLASSDLRVLLVDGYTVNAEHNFVSAVSSYEVSGSGYVRKQLINKSVSRDSINHRIKLTADDVLWTLANFQADGGVIYEHTGNDNTAPLIAYLDFGVVKRSQNTDFKIEWSDAEGIINIR